MNLFLDCDGVINSKSSWKVPFFIDTKCIKVLSDVCKTLGCADIVLISTWKAGFDKFSNNHTPQVQALIRELSKYGISIVGATVDGKAKGLSRDEEIQLYIKRQRIEDYIILDDDESLYKDKTNLYLVDYNTGLTKDDVRRIRHFIG